MLQNDHLSDEDLLRAADGEIAPRFARRVSDHLAACWSCRVRRKTIEETIADFVRLYQRDSAEQWLHREGSRALLKARLAELAESHNGAFLPPLCPFVRSQAGAGILVVALVVVVGLFAILRTRPAGSQSQIAIATPNSALTPGATVWISSHELCAKEKSKNRTVPIVLQRKVFEEYGIVGADPRAYEVDYLITPALGGADDIHNLWPESYAATAWNAEAKDMLEDYLRDSVCGGQLDLATAQRDISSDWIAAYKKYFHTETPLKTARR
jgi:hypothetical protein